MRINAVCLLCGEPYIKSNGKSKYCSDACRREATRIRQKEWRESHPDYQKEWHKAHDAECESAINQK